MHAGCTDQGLLSLHHPPSAEGTHTHTHTHTLTIAQGLLCILSMGAVYFTVARGVTVGAIEVVNSTISFNTTAVRYGG